MSDRDWDAELKKIDAAMAKQPAPAAPPAGAAVQKPAPQAAPSAAPAAFPGGLGLPGPTTSSFGVYLRLALSVAVGVGIIFWPYSARCGAGLALYLSAVATVIVSGVWSAVWTFRHRAARAHVLSLLLVLWGLVLASLDVLPRAGYAIPTAGHPATWACEA